MPEGIADSFRVSPQQEELWLTEPEGPSERVQAVVALAGPLDAGALERALRQTVERHESLRTTFVRQSGIRVPLQVVGVQLHPSWRTLDLGDLDGATQAEALQQQIRAEVEEPLDFERGPLVRALLVRRAEDRHSLVLTLSALCADASSVPTLLRELVDHLGGAGELVEEPLQYADFAEWQHELITTEDEATRSAADFWATFTDAPPVHLPFSRGAVGPFVPAEVELDLDGELAAAIAAQGARYGVGIDTFVQAAWHALVGRASGEESVVTGFVSLQRRHADLEGAIGAFARSLPVRAPIAGAVTFAEVLRAVEQARDEAVEWQDYAPARAAAGLTVGFLAPEMYRGTAGELSFSLERVVASGRPVGLALSCESSDDRLRLRFCFDPRRHERESVERFAHQLERLLGGAAADPGVAVGEIELLDDAERHRILVDFNDTSAPIPGECVHELIAARAAATPARDAVLDEHGSISYGELDARANQLAHRLRRSGVGPDVAVGLCTDRSVDMVVGLLGILKAGGAYLPLHFEYPPARLAHQLTTAGAAAIVTQEALLPRLPGFGGEIVCLDRDRAALDAEPAAPPDVQVTHEDLVYVIYTSGSTGTPKGVAVTHGNLVNYTSDIVRRLGAESESLTFGTVTSISTDLGNTVVFGALCSGGTLVLVNPMVAADAAALARQLESTPVDVLKITPSHIGALLAARDPRVLPRRCLVLGGERAPWDLVARIRELSSCAILNHYGPTEATVGCCTMGVPDGPGPFEPATVPIGRPIANTACYVLDEHRRPAPLGVLGRLFVGGAGVARGYIGDPELTAQRFLPDPFASATGARMYDTGDLARWLPDGTLAFLGRSDEQVKIRGYRVEPSEVETALRSHPQVREAVVVAREGAAGDTRLIAYCAVEGDASQDDLREHLAGWLPDFMLPAVIATLDSLPTTPSGKVDLLALPDPATISEAAPDYVAPRSQLEQTVAAIWSHVLGVEKVGAEDDFFALGGHSLLATQVVAQVRSDLAVELPLHSLFTYPTVASLASEISQMMGDAEEDETARLVAELEGMSDEEAERLLSEDQAPSP